VAAVSHRALLGSDLGLPLTQCGIRPQRIGLRGPSDRRDVEPVKGHTAWSMGLTFQCANSQLLELSLHRRLAPFFFAGRVARGFFSNLIRMAPLTSRTKYR
jgi:hypothetical protein